MNRKTNPDVHIICGKCGCGTMMEYTVKLHKVGRGEDYVPYLTCTNCNTVTALYETIKHSNNEHTKS
jgi:hypothetical protein